MQFSLEINPDRPVPALVGNGQLVTTIGRTGYHEPDEWPPDAASTQELVMAGRRLAGPRHQLLPFGWVERSVWINGEEPKPVERGQTIHTETAEVRTRLIYENALEATRTLVFAHRNTLLVETRLANHSNEDLSLLFILRYRFGKRPIGHADVPELRWERETHCGAVLIPWETHDNLGVVRIATAGHEWKWAESDAVLEVQRTLDPGAELVLRTAISISDRIEYQNAFDFAKLDEELHRHFGVWRDFWATSELTTEDETVDRFREIALYTVACQATPWSIPPTVSERYWSAGAFHDEYYPFVGLLSGGFEHIARRVPYYRLATLPEAVKRARGQGALYPWSATEDGHERDPHGHWYSERFHLGQIAACAWVYWLYERTVSHLDDLYPVIRECARYFENCFLETDDRGRLRTRRCTDFDESAGEVAGGPFTMAAAVYCLDRACEAARRLGLDRERRSRWESLARRLRQSFAIDLRERRYTIPGIEHMHVAIAGYVVPFFCDDGSEFARNSVLLIHDRAKETFGWKPGFGPAFDKTAWLWTAGHLGMCHSVLSDGDAAWQVVREGPRSCGQFMCPTEHLNAKGEPVVPWFTTGCGAWLAALHWMFARVDDNSDYLLPAVPESLTNFSFRGLRLSRGVSAAARVQGGCLVYLSLTAPTPITFSFEVPARFAHGAWPGSVGKIVDLDGNWRIQVDLLPGENVFVEIARPARRGAAER